VGWEGLNICFNHLVLNITLLHGEGFNGMLAHPVLLRVDNASEGKSQMWMQMSVKPLEAQISRL